MRRIVRWIVCVLLLAGGACAGGERPAPSAARGSAPTSAVLFAPSHPVFVRFRIEVDGQDLGRFRDRAVTQWFRQLDRNHDGFVDKKEIAPFLNALAEQAGMGPQPKWERIDLDPVDGKVSPREFRAFVDRQLGPPLALAVRRESGSEVDASLFRHLDLNGDGVLTVDELRHAKRSLTLLDADDDETISTAELLAASPKPASAPRTSGPRPLAIDQAPQSAAAQPPTDRLPVMILGPDAPPDALARALVREYGATTSPEGERRVSAKGLGLAAAEIRRSNGAGAGSLGVGELAQLLLEVPPQLEVSFQLYDQQRGRPRVSVARGTHPPAFEWQQASSDSGMLVVNGLKVALSAKRTRGATGDMASFYALRFNIVDQDKNNYLDRREFAALGLPGADFAAVDANGDGQIVEAELVDYLKRQGNVYVNQVVLAVADESQSLFEFLDTRPDGRLSARELNAAATRLQALDRNQDGNLTLGELRTQIRLEAEVKRPQPARPVLPVARNRTQASTPVSPDRGPEWFRRMDRNYDGDLSWREFLGPRSAFDRLDTDHDGLLSPEEAERAR